MNPQHQRDLTDLRKAAAERDQAQLQFLLKRLLQHMDYFVALTVPLERAYEYIDIFESYYPDEAWVRQLLLAITSFGTAPDDGVAEMALKQDFSAPGARNFLKAIFDITQAMQAKHTGEARISFMTSAVVNAIMAELVEAWYGDQEAAWEQVRNNTYDPVTETYSDPEAVQIAYTFWQNPQTAALDTALWTDVADAVEKKLTRLRKAAE